MSGFAHYLNLGDGGYQSSWFSELICTHLDLVLKTARGLPGGLDALAIHMPPRHGKTLHCAELFPAYAAAVDPDLEMIGLTYSLTNAKKSTKAVGRIIESPAYQRLCATRIGSAQSVDFDDQGKAVARKVTGTQNANLIEMLHPEREVRGQYLSTSLGGQCTGSGANIMVYDDLIKNAAEAESLRTREFNEAELEQTAFTRLYKRSAQVLLATRWHPLDPCSFLVRRWEEQGLNYAVLNLRAEREEEDLDYDPREPGQFLDEERIGRRKYEQMKSGSSWDALYQQRPTAGGGRLFPSHYWGAYDPEWLEDGSRNGGRGLVDELVISIDPNFKKDGTSFAQADVWALVTLPGATPHEASRREAWKLDEVRGKWDYPQLRAEIMQLWRKWGASVRWILVEDKANGHALAAEIERARETSDDRGMRRAELVVCRTGTISKETRAQLAQPTYRAGLLRLPSKPRGVILRDNDWVAEHKAEFERFGIEAGADDRVDTMVQFVRWAAEHAGLVPPFGPSDPPYRT